MRYGISNGWCVSSRGQTNDRVAAFHFLPTVRAVRAMRSNGFSICHGVGAMGPPAWTARRARAKAPPTAPLGALDHVDGRFGGEGLVVPLGPPRPAPARASCRASAAWPEMCGKSLGWIPASAHSAWYRFWSFCDSASHRCLSSALSAFHALPT